ncbi:MAG: hypothetical protein HC803_10735 [Saprospiraceae bacterium]|nr:hypothetical protein [Saprospiraceae bacterium]
MIDNNGWVTIDNTIIKGDPSSVEIPISENINATFAKIHTHHNQGAVFYNSRGSKRTMGDPPGVSTADWGNALYNFINSVGDIEKSNKYFNVVVDDTYIYFYRRVIVSLKNMTVNYIIKRMLPNIKMKQIAE